MRLLHAIAAKILSFLSHVPLVNKVIGDFDWAVFALLLLLFGIAIYWAKTRWGQVEPTEGKKFFSRITTNLRNFRAKIVLAIGSLVMLFVFSGVFAAGMLGTGSEVDLKGGPLVIGTHKAIYIAYAEKGTRDGEQGWHVVIQLPGKDGQGYDKEHPWAAFISESIITPGANIRQGGEVGLAIVNNYYIIIPKLPA